MARSALPITAFQLPASLADLQFLHVSRAYYRAVRVVALLAIRVVALEALHGDRLSDWLGGPLHGLAPPADGAPASPEPADPELTTALCQDIADMSSRRSGRKRGGRATEPPSRTDSDSGNHVSPRNAKFTALILDPRRIRIENTNVIAPSAFAQFSADEPLPGVVSHYAAVASLSGARIWVQMLASGADAPAGLSSAESAHWRFHPLLDDSAGETEWAWGIRPDCAFWLSLKGFTPEYRSQIQNCAFVRQWVTCPYFTIEFKLDGESEDVAAKPVAAAGSLALYNRYYLPPLVLRTLIP
ncbi:hypothetical protein GE09DRAFT_1196263 [Coniochaeta sp. 2T2.1]|nr:hypothetical protein GE09DRAFT_1196263 [Coniochaeta sp. 2T2.1]